MTAWAASATALFSSDQAGHSYGAFGLVNPAFAMGAAIANVSKLTVPDKH